MKRFVKLFSFFLSIIFLPIAASAAVWTIAIDPGHGGKDPGAISRNLRIYEKNVTLSIARELKALLDKDPNFKGVLTRRGDYYISVPERSEIARKNRANYLISIHADSSINPALRGASVWVLSNRRASDEMGQWLEDHEKQSELLGGAGKVLANHNEKYLNQTVLDLQFAHSQRVGYELGNTVLRHFGRITQLSRSRPQHASLGVLRSPDIPSILVETGFLSNQEEELRLNNPAYRRKLARIIYDGLVEYRKRHGGADAAMAAVNPDDDKAKQSKNSIKDSGVRHKVKKGETLLGLTNKYKVKSDDIVKLNKLKSRNLLIGQTIKIPHDEKTADIKAGDGDSKRSSQPQLKLTDSGIRHKVKKGETLIGLAGKYNVKSDDIAELNNLKKRNLQIGQTIKIHQAEDSRKETQKSAKSAVRNSQKMKISEAEKPDSKTKSKEIPKYHTIKKDETVYAVSRKYGIPADKLLKLNKLKDGKVKVGQKIKLRD